MRFRNNIRKIRKFILPAIAVIIVAGGFCIKHYSSSTQAVFPEISIDENFFPDPILRKYVQDNIDKNHDNKMTYEEAGTLTELNLAGLGIQNFDGIGFIDNIQILDISDNKIAKVELHAGFQELTTVRAKNNKLTAIDVSNLPNLTTLDINGNYSISTLDLSKNPLISELDTTGTSIKSLTIPPSLKKLSAGSSHLRELQTQGVQTNLTSLILSYGFTSCFHPDKLPGLTNLEIQHPQTEPGLHLDLTPLTKLANLEINGPTTSITALTLPATSTLTRTWIQHTDIASLDLSHNPNLSNLVIGDNNLAFIDTNNTKVEIPAQFIYNTGNIFYADSPILTPSALPKGFDVSRVRKLTGGRINGNTILTDKPGTRLQYDYVVNTKTNLMGHFEIQTPTGITIDSNTFPDNNLRAEISKNFDKNNDSFLTDKEIEQAKSLNVSGKNIANTKGLELLPKLTTLNISNNSNIFSLDAKALPSLQGLYISNTGITSIDLSIHTALKFFESDNLTYNSNSRAFNIKDLPGNFEKAKMSELTNATFYPGGVIEAQNNSPITYKYSTGNTKFPYITVKIKTPIRIPINSDTFPDNNLRAEISAKFDTDKDNFLSAEEIEKANNLDASGKNITNTKGLELLPKLIILNLSNNPNLNSFDAKPLSSLYGLYISNTGITSIDLSTQTSLGFFESDNLLYNVNSRTFNTKDLPGNFNKSNIIELTNATISPDGEIKAQNNNPIIYKYSTGYAQFPYITVSIKTPEYHEPPVPTGIASLPPAYCAIFGSGLIGASIALHKTASRSKRRSRRK